MGQVAEWNGKKSNNQKQMRSKQKQGVSGAKIL